MQRSSTPGASCSRSIVVSPPRARPVWFVTSPTRAPDSRANLSSLSTSRPVHTGVSMRAPELPACSSNTAEATTVATRPRKAVTSPAPEGCSRLDKKTTNVSDAGSSQSDVPVKPVCPYDPIGNRSPRLEENRESRSHPSPRRSARCGGVETRVIRATESGARIRTSSSAPPSSNIRQNRARSPAVLNSPACPATPPIRRAVGSCTRPRSITAPSPPQGHASGAHRSVGAIRRVSDEGGLNAVSVIWRGRKIRSRANRSRVWPVTRRTISPNMKKLMSL